MSSVYTVPGSQLQFHVASGALRAMASNAVLITGAKHAVLIDTLLIEEDARRLAATIRSTGKELTTILITHAHPDHYFGLPIIQKEFPKAQVFARPTTVEFLKEFAAKIIHWQEMYRGEIPTALELPRILEVNSIRLEDNDIQILDLEMVETTAATAFYVPAASTLIAADLIYSQCHHYMSDVGRADTWIDAIEKTRKTGPIDRIIPGHGPGGGLELFDASIRWMRDYEKVATPGKRFTEIAKEMINLYPKHGLAMLLWVTRGPGFGLAGARDIGAPTAFNAPGEHASYQNEHLD
jgi:glyoxylase-like metal-dependent hydrolase (beta-lactamase superfamily II)